MTGKRVLAMTGKRVLAMTKKYFSCLAFKKKTQSSF
jgi:hypothetical protein